MVCVCVRLSSVVKSQSSMPLVSFGEHFEGNLDGPPVSQTEIE